MNLVDSCPVLLELMWLNSTVYSRHRLTLGLIYLCLLKGSTNVFRYYSLGGDTAMPGGLYAGLCYSFLVLFYSTCASTFNIGDDVKYHYICVTFEY